MNENSSNGSAVVRICNPVAPTSVATAPVLAAEPQTQTPPPQHTFQQPHQQHRCRTRMGTIQSATFNIWSTMVGGGSLSLPLAFTKSGNLLVGPILLILTAILTEFCFGLLIDATYFINHNQQQPQQPPPQQQPLQEQQQQQKRSDSHQVSMSSSTTNSTTAASMLETTNNTLLSETNGNDEDDTLITTQERQQQLAEVEHDVNECSTYTLESITAAAATAFAATASGGTENDHPNHHDDSNNTTNANWAYSMSALLVLFMCFFGIIGYCVLLRDMLLPVTQWIQQQQLFRRHHAPPSFGDGSTMTQFSMSVDHNTNTTVSDNESTVTWANNLSMIIVVFIVTPLCTLQTLTSLQKFSTLSMFSVLILGLCIVYRSVQCHLGYNHTPSHGGDDNSNNNNNNTNITSFYLHHDSEHIDEGDDAGHSHAAGGGGFTWVPHNIKDVLDVLPLYISCYVCHYNIPVVYNDFVDPTPTRVRLWLHITVWGATTFYCIIGIAGSSFALVCGSHHHIVQGNVLLNFDPDDPLLLIGRLCLAVTIALAFPVLTIPARDIILRYMVSTSDRKSTRLNSSHSIASRMPSSA